MTPTRSDRLWACVIALIAFTTDLRFLSKAYVFEGLVRAMPIETGRFVHLFAGNYLLYGPLGLIFHLLLRVLGFHLLAVTSLQIMDSLLGVAGLYVFFLFLRRLGGDRFLCTVGCVVLGCSLGYWLWSTEAEDYILSTFLLLLNFYNLVRYSSETSKDPVFLGILHGLAILGHVVNVVFAPVVLWVIYSTHGKDWRGPTMKYTTAALVVVVASYGVVLGIIQKPTSASLAWQWFLGSAGANGPHLGLGEGPSPDKIWTWLKMTLHIFVSDQRDYASPPVGSGAAYFIRGAKVLLVVFLGMGVFRRRALWRRYATVIGACGVWLIAYACVFTSWQPQTMVYRVSDLIPLCTLLFLIFQILSDQSRGWRAAAGVLVVCLAIGNFSSVILPRSNVANNPNLARMAFIKEHTQEGDWVTGDGGQDEIYIPYFAERRPIVVARFTSQPERLTVLMDDLLKHRQSVYVTSRILGADPWSQYFKRYRLSETANDSNGFVIYRVNVSSLNPDS